jgi:5-oxoprolinase (ATP-hydrolysing)
VPNEDLLTLLGENVRKPKEVLGDIFSFVSANQLGAERLLRFMDDYGMHDLRALAAVVQNRAEAAMREAIRALPNDVYRSEAFNNPLGTRLSYPLKLTVRDDEIELDFEGAPPQQPQGGLNCTYSYTAAHATYPLKCMLSPQVRGNAGCYRPFTVKAPEGSILNCEKPASVNLRTRTGWYLAPNIFRALAKAAPSQVQAQTGLPHAVSIYGREASGHVYADHFFMGGGQGASARGDGKSALLYPTSAANTSIELMESRAPVLVLEKTLITDSGGAGRERGGLGSRTRIRKLHDDGLPTLFSVYPEGVAIAPEGLFGGEAGGEARGVVLDRAGNVVHDCGTGELVTLTTVDRVVEVCLAGGAGFGDPRERATVRVEADVADGYVSEDGARRYLARRASATAAE